MNTLALLAVVNTVAEQTGAKHRYVAWCVCCVNERDPKWELPARRAPDNAQCFSCGIPAREREGMCFVLVPA